MLSKPLDSSIAFKPRLQVLTSEQLDMIHCATLEVLERTGVILTHRRAREILQGAGARVDGKRVFIPSWLVEEALRSAPKRVVLGRRDGEREVFLERDRVWFGPSVDCVDYLDPLNGERRRFTSADCRVTATVADALPNYTWVMTIGMAADVAPDIADRVIAREVMSHCEKPLVFCCKDLDSTRDIYEMAVTIAGSEERFRAAPPIVHYSEPISPLVHYDPAIDKLLFCVEKGIPLVYYPAPQAGSTAPMSLAGTLVQGSAESLSGLVLAQLARRGAPFIYGAFTTVMDMSTMVFSYGAPEMSLMTAAMAQLAQRYGLPFFGTAGCSDAKMPDAQSAAEAVFSCLSSALSGANLVHDSGWLDHGAVASPEYMVLVHEVLDMVNHYVSGLPVGMESLAIDLIDRVGPGGHFLQEPHTLQHFREVWYSRLFDRTIYQQWVERGADTFGERLRARTLRAMEHKPAPLAADVVREIDAQARHWR
ncbi:MAG: trimethylamine methyltransferase [Chloroflexi bacterium]|nr:trimethylamine methyltransferase [Chloroflexota bacterium]